MIRLVISTSVVVSAMYVLSAQVSGQQGCFQTTMATCAACVNAGLGGPFGGSPPDCRNCNCSGQVAGATCGCTVQMQIFAGVLMLGQPCQNPGVEQNGCKDNWTLKTKPDGTLDDVACAEYQACKPDCRPFYQILSNGQWILLGYKCVTDTTSPRQTVRCNQVQLTGSGC